MNIFQKRTLRAIALAATLLAPFTVHPASAQSGKICFTQMIEKDEDDSSRIFVMNDDGSNLTRLNLAPGLFREDFPELSPDGSKIVFLNNYMNKFSSFDLYIMNSNGTQKRRLASNQGDNKGILFASFTPDGSKIGYLQSNYPQPSDFYLINPDGTGKTKIGSIDCNGPFSFNADATQIVYEKYVNGLDIFTADLATLEETPLIANPNVHERYPTFNKAGTKIAFGRYFIAGANPQDGIYSMNPNGSNLKFVSDKIAYSALDFSGDDQRIIFSAGLGLGLVGICSVNLAGSDFKLLQQANLGYRAYYLSCSLGNVDTPAIANINDASVLEADTGAKDMTFTVRLSKPAPFQAEVDYVTANGTATGFYDYTRISGTLHFEPGEQSKTIRVPILGDTEDETDETLFVRLSNGKNLNLGDDEGVGTVLSDEVPKAPSNVSLTPTSETSGPGEARIFTAVYRDPNFTQDIASAMLRVGNNNSNSLRTQYNPVTNKLYLLNDAGTAYLGGFAPGSAQVISNKQGSLNCAATTVSRAGELLTVNWSLTPSSAFMGVRDLYLMVRDRTGLVAGWDALGIWSITANLPPVNVSLSPDDVTIAAGTAQTLGAKYSDPNGTADLVSVMLRVGDRNTGGLRGMYHPVTNKLYLLGDDGKSYLGGFAPGAVQIISNSQGSLDCSRTAVSKSGNNLTVNWNFTLSSGYLGPHNVSLYARDRASQVDGWDALGIWH